MKKKICCILMIIVLLLNSSAMLIISEAVDAIQTNEQESSEDKTKPLIEMNLTKYENFDTTDTTAEGTDTGSKGVLVQFNLKTGIHFAEGEEYKTIKKTSTNVDLPWIGDYKPSRVEVITKSTQATNGDKNATYEYHSSTGILSIVSENNDYTENNADARDEYEVICIYRKECYTDNEERNFKIRAGVQEILNDEQETKIVDKAEQEYTLKDNVNTVISVEHQTDDIYDGYMTANSLNPENQYETTYNENLKIMVSNKDLASKIEVKENSENSLYVESTIDKNQVLDIIGDNGSIDILDENENILSTINKDTETDENGKIKVTYENKTQNLYIRLNNVAKEGIIEVQNSRVIPPTAQIVDNTINTQVSIKGVTADNIVKYERNGQSNIQIKQAVSNIETKINTETLVNNTTNDVLVTATLKTDSPQYSLFKNPVINIEVPAEVEKVELGTPEIIYDNQVFKIISSDVTTNASGNKVVNIQVEGAQTSYENSSVVEGATLRVPLTLTLVKNMESKVGNINISYSNEITGTTENKTTEVTLLNKIVNNVQTSNTEITPEVIENTQAGVDTSADSDGIKTEITEIVGNAEVGNNGTIYERQIVKQNIKVTNTSNVAKKVIVTINIPDEMTYVKLKTGGYIQNEEKGYYTYLDEYEYEEQEDKQVTVELTVNAGETKTDFIELKVKDLQDSEQEKTTQINGSVQVNNGSATQFNIQNTIKQAEVSVELKSMVGASGSRREWDYVIYITNLTDKELSNVKLDFVASSFFNIKEVEVEANGDRLTNVSGNTWTYTLDKLETGEKTLYVKGEVGEIEDSKSSSFEINGLTTVYVNNSTYVSNKTRMNGCVEAVDVNMTTDKEKIKMDEEVTYTVNIKNIGKTYGVFGTYTRVNVTDVIPRELTPISVTYNDYQLNEEKIQDENAPKGEYTVSTFTEQTVTKDISALDIPEGYDQEDAPNINLLLTIPEGKTVTMTIKAKARMIDEDKKITNSVTVAGDYIKTKTDSVTNTVLRYDYNNQNNNPNNPDNPNDPNNPNNPSNPDDPNNSNNSTNAKISISGIAWVDANEDGKRTTDEQTYSNMQVMLYDYKNNTFVKENGQIKKVQTNSAGEYAFDNIDKGNYIVIFLYDSSKYSLTDYQKEGVLESKNSDAITKTVGINGETVTAGLTDTLVANSNLENIDIGLVENKNFDLQMQKYISKITIQTNDGKTKTYDYNNKQFAKVEVRSKKLNGATAIIEYKMVVTNTGEVDGKAVQIIDKLPDGLTFKSELNNNWYEKDGSVYTNSLSGENIAVGESKEVTLVLTKNINSSNVGTIVNNASIGISSNDKAIEDGNAQNNNSSAQVIIAVATGIAQQIGITIVTMAGLIALAVLIMKNKKMFKTTLFISIFAICLTGSVHQVLGASAGSPDKNITIRGIFDGVNNTGTHLQYSVGSDGYRYECDDHGLTFCRAWHNATLESNTNTKQAITNWTDVQKTLTLKDNTNKSNVKISKLDDNYNKIGPFNVTSDISNASHQVTVTYKDKDGKTATKDFDLIDFGWGKDFYIKIPASVIQIQKITVKGSNTVTQTRKVNVTYTYIYKITGHTSENYCRPGHAIQRMYRTETVTKTESQPVKREASIDINGPWTGVGDLEIKKVDSINTETPLQNTKFKLIKGTDKTKSMVIYKDDQRVKSIRVEQDITLNQDSSATIDGESGYTVKFDSAFDDATTLITNSEGKVLIKNLELGQYTFIETGNLNYGYTKMVTSSINGFDALRQTTWTIKNEKQVGEIDIKKVDDRNENKILPGVEFVLRSTYREGYIKVKVDRDDVEKDEKGWVKRIVGTCTIKDTGNKTTDPVVTYTTNIDEATRFVTDENAELKIQNLLMSSDGKDSIQYKLEEVANPNYGYLADTNQYKNHNVTYAGDTITNDGWITPKLNNKVSVKIKNHQEYIRIEGFVWEEILNSKSNTINNLYNNSDALVEGLKVYLCKDGQVLATQTTDSNGWYCFGSRKDDGEGYTNDDYLTATNGNLLIDDLATYYVEFEYDGLRFTSVQAVVEYLNENYDNTSKATEVPNGRNDRKDRASVNADFSEITNNASRNNGQKVYDLDYDYDTKTHMSAYKDYWGYEYNADKTRLKVTPADYYQIIASTQTSGFNLKEAWEKRCASNGAENLTGINLGIYRREQADLAIMNDIQDVNVVVANYENTYTYAKRKEYEDQNENDENYNSAKDGFGVDVKFGTILGSYSSRGLNMYTRRIYESDLALLDKQSNDILKIYVTYKMTIKNQASNLNAVINEISNYYDSNYTIADSWIKQGDKEIQIGANSWSNTSKYQDSYNANGYQAVYTQQTGNITLGPNEKFEVYIKFRLNNEAAKELIEKQTTLNNVTEITSFSTLTTGNNGLVPYAAIDGDSNPGSVKSIELAEDRTTTTTLNGREYQIDTKAVDTTYFEDDTDTAPSLVLGIEESKDRGLSGTVFEDENANAADDESHPGEERMGDGILYTGENGEKYQGNGAYAKVDRNRVRNAKVELLVYDDNTSDHIARKADGTAEVAQLYQLEVSSGIARGKQVDAVTNTDQFGNYQFLGVVPGRYLLRYTYGENTWIVDSNGNDITEINVRDYKSTIITSNLMKTALNLEKKIDASKDERMGDLNWILTYAGQDGQAKSKNKDVDGLIRYSDATDDISQRNAEDDIYFGSYSKNASISADTAFFDVGVEYSEVSEDGFGHRVSYTDYKDEYNLSNDRIIVLAEDADETNDKGAKLKLKLKDTFYSVNPYQDFGIIERARQDYEVNKRISNLRVVLSNGQVLVDGNPYLQSVDLPIDLDEYWNNLEKTPTADKALPYTKALPGDVNVEIDNELLQGIQVSVEYTITIRNKSEKDYKYTDSHDYYYYGINGKDEITTAIRKVVDYMDDSLNYDDDSNESQGWMKVTADNLKNWKDDGEDPKQLIALPEDKIGDKSYNVYDGIKKGYTIGVTEAFYNGGNGIGVGKSASVKIYGKRLISTSETGFSAQNHAEIIETMGIRTLTNSIPGNYNPSESGGSPDEPDDDKTKLTITPPTGLADNKIFVISMTAIILVVLASGIVVIKKKVLG